MSPLAFQLVALLPLPELVRSLLIELLLVHSQHGYHVGLPSQQLQKVKEAFVSQPELLFDPSVSLKSELPDEIDQHPNAGAYEALKLVDDHLLIGQHLHVQARIVLVQVWIQDGLQVRVIDGVAGVLE